MARNMYLIISGIIFGLVALLHLGRLVYGWEVQFGAWTVPFWLSWGGFFGAGILCFWAFWQLPVTK
ncbi:MAG: hypothetical protein CVT49_10175 [candidate division Zixibacteria bacterium HGW-Zixibacteria-1]|nr:MAG: hypothetical protein CVT49_10175 [candidate division Zixibacteria bacterium HGW-Zixibacteria-1]